MDQRVHQYRAHVVNYSVVGNAQQKIGSYDVDCLDAWANRPFAVVKGLLPLKPRRTEKGDGWLALITMCRCSATVPARETAASHCPGAARSERMRRA